MYRAGNQQYRVTQLLHSQKALIRAQKRHNPLQAVEQFYSLG